MQLTYPGVYVTEIPSSVRPIATVSTSIAAFVDRFATGDVDKAVQIFGMADFERLFGGIVAYSPASYQVAQFFLNGGSSAWIVQSRGNPSGTYSSIGCPPCSIGSAGSYSLTRTNADGFATPIGRRSPAARR